MKKIYNYYYWKQVLFIKCYMTIVLLKNGILIIFESHEKVWLVYTVDAVHRIYAAPMQGYRMN